MKLVGSQLALFDWLSKICRLDGEGELAGFGVATSDWLSKICTLAGSGEQGGSGVAGADWVAVGSWQAAWGTALARSDWLAPGHWPAAWRTALVGEGVARSKGGPGAAWQGDSACVAGMPVGHVMADMPITNSRCFHHKRGRGREHPQRTWADWACTSGRNACQGEG